MEILHIRDIKKIFTPLVVTSCYAVQPLLTQRTIHNNDKNAPFFILIIWLTSDLGWNM